MRHVISTTIERLVSFALFMVGIVAVVVTAIAFLLIANATLI